MDKKTILVVDDDATTVNVLEECLKELGYGCESQMMDLWPWN